MTATAEKVLLDALQLPEAERTQLVGSLLESLGPVDEGADEAWAKEIEVRLAQLQSGNVESIPWHVVRARLWSKLDTVD